MNVRSGILILLLSIIFWNSGCAVSDSEPPLLCEAPESLHFGLSDTSKTFSIENCGGGDLSYLLVFESEDWLIPPGDTSGVAPSTIEVKVRREDQHPGSYNAAIRIQTDHGNAIISVSMDVGEPGMSTNPSAGHALHFSPEETRRILTVSNDGVGPLTYSVSLAATWLTATEGSLEGTLQTGGSAEITLDLVEGTLLKDIDFAEGEVVISGQYSEAGEVRLAAYYSTIKDCPADCGGPTELCVFCRDPQGRAHCDSNRFCRIPPAIEDIVGIDALTGEEMTFAEAGCEGEAGWEIKITGSYFSPPLPGEESGKGNVIRFDTALAEEIDVASAGEAYARVPGDLFLPENGELLQYAISITTYGVPSEAYIFDIRQAMPEIASVIPDSAEIGDTITLHGRNFQLCNASEVLVWFSGCSEGIAPDNTADTEIDVTIPTCATTGPLWLEVDGKQSRKPHPDIVVQKTEEKFFDLNRSPPFAAEISKNGQYLAMLTSATGFKLQLWDMSPGNIHELRCGNEEGEPCLEVDAISQVAGFHSDDELLSVYTYGGGDAFLSRIDFHYDENYENNAPSSPVDIICEGDMACGSASSPTSIMADPSGRRLLLIIAGGIYELSLENNQLRRLSDEAYLVRNIIPGPYWRYGYGVVTINRSDPLIAVFDIAPHSINGDQISVERGEVVSDPLTTGFVDVRLAVDPTGNFLLAIDPSGEGIFMIRRWDISDPRNPTGMSPLGLDNAQGISVLSALTFSADGRYVYGSEKSEELYRFDVADDEVVQVSEALGVSPIQMNVSDDNGRLLLRSADAVSILSLNRPAPLVESIEPELLTRGDELTVRFANDACDGRSFVNLLFPGAPPIELDSTEQERQNTGDVNEMVFSGSAKIQCEGRPESLEIPLLVGRKHNYTNFQAGDTIAKILVIDQNELVWAILVNESPGKVGRVQINSEGMIEEESALLNLGESYSILDASVHNEKLYGIRRDAGGIFIADLNTWEALPEQMSTPSGLPNPRGIAFNETTNELLITDGTHDYLYRIDLSTRDDLTPYGLGACEKASDVLVRDASIYVACEDSASLLALDVATGEIRNEAGLGFPVTSLGPGRNQNYLLVSGGDRAAMILVNESLGGFGDSIQEFVVGVYPVATMSGEDVFVGSGNGLYAFNNAGLNRYKLFGRFFDQATAVESSTSCILLVGMPEGEIRTVLFPTSE